MNRYRFKPLMVILLLLTISGNLYCQDFPVEIINYCGPPNEFLNIVIMGDGYKADQQDKFILEAKNAINGFFATAPFNQYKDSINVFAIKVISNAEGASLDPNNLIDNYFGSSYFSYGIERLLVAWRTSKIITVLNVNAPFYDKAVIMVNDTKYGGSGGQFPVFSVNGQSIGLLLHEFAHSLSNLADEYWAGPQYAAEKPNMTQDNNRETIRWKAFLDINQVGIYPHAESPTWYRPHQNCMMRYLGSPYCDVCKNEIILDIESYINTDTLHTPFSYFAASDIEIKTDETVNFIDLSTNRPQSWEWTFPGGSPSASTERNPSISYPDAGTYSVTLKVTNQIGSNTTTKTGYIKVQQATVSELVDYSGKIMLYPNPARDILAVSTLPDIYPAKFRILNLTGVTVKEGLFRDQVDISGLPSGIYFIVFDLNNRLTTLKFVKE